jgi:ketosteroid isomerase-like protein
MVALMAGTLLFSSCADPAASNATSNTGNKAANAANTATAPAANTAAVETDIKKMMDEFTVALNKGDTAVLDKMYSDNYTLIDQDGAIQSKASRMEAIKSGKVKWEGLAFSDLNIKSSPAGDGAVVVGRASGRTMMDGKSEDRNSMVTWVLGKTADKGWQFVSAQITDIKGGAAAAKTDEKKADEKAADTVPEKK